MSLPKTITLDGPAGSGKSTIAFIIARELGYLPVDTGALYRAVTLAALRAFGSSAAQTDDAQIVALAAQTEMDVIPGRSADGHDYTVLLNGEDVTAAIRAPEVEGLVSRIAAISGVRDVLNQKYRALAAARDRVIMAGRDIGTVVLPNADLKIYLDASLDVRAERRYQQALQGGHNPDRETTQSAVELRDQKDSQRAVAPLRPARDAYHINTDDMDAASVAALVLQLIREWDSH